MEEERALYQHLESEITKGTLETIGNSTEKKKPLRLQEAQDLRWAAAGYSAPAQNSLPPTSRYEILIKAGQVKKIAWPGGVK